jgi:uncharacterized protein (TIGR03435 family)
MRKLSIIGIAAFVMCADLAAGQAPDTRQSTAKFDVASVRANLGKSGSTSYLRWSPRGLTAVNHPLRNVIAEAYEISLPFIRHRLVGGPNRILSMGVDIDAVAPEGTSDKDRRAMLKSLLEERFNLRTRSESRMTAVYALSVMRDREFGRELRQSEHNCDEIFALLRAQQKTPADGIESPRDAKGRALCWYREAEDPTPRGAFRRRNAGTILRLITDTQAFVDRPVVDATGLGGNFEWELLFNPVGDNSNEFPSIWTAFEEQLGLKLQPRMMPLDVVVIESLDEPSPN